MRKMQLVKDGGASCPWGGAGPSGSEIWSLPYLLTFWLAGPPMNPDPWLCLGLVTLSEVQAERCVFSQALICALSSSLFSPWLFLSAHSSLAREGRQGGDGEQKCQRDIKQSASVCALIVQPVWFPSPPSHPPFLLLTSPLYTLLHRAINSSSLLQISLSFLLHQHPYHFFCKSSLPTFALIWFITPRVKASTTTNSNKNGWILVCFWQNTVTQKRNINHRRGNILFMKPWMEKSVNM